MLAIRIIIGVIMNCKINKLVENNIFCYNYFFYIPLKLCCQRKKMETEEYVFGSNDLERCGVDPTLSVALLHGACTTVGERFLQIRYFFSVIISNCHKKIFLFLNNLYF
jgi:hypothetical protein